MKVCSIFAQVSKLFSRGDFEKLSRSTKPSGTRAVSRVEASSWPCCFASWDEPRYAPGLLACQEVSACLPRSVSRLRVLPSASSCSPTIHCPRAGHGSDYDVGGATQAAARKSAGCAPLRKFRGIRRKRLPHWIAKVGQAYSPAIVRFVRNTGHRPAGEWRCPRREHAPGPYDASSPSNAARTVSSKPRAIHLHCCIESIEQLAVLYINRFTSRRVAPAARYAQSPHGALHLPSRPAHRAYRAPARAANPTASAHARATCCPQ